MSNTNKNYSTEASGNCSRNKSSRISTEEDTREVEIETPSRKRLYRDVLESAPSVTVAAEDNSFERRYDELERQAMEQYRNSEECLALRYQVRENKISLQLYRVVLVVGSCSINSK